MSSVLSNILLTCATVYGIGVVVTAASLIAIYWNRWRGPARVSRGAKSTLVLYSIIDAIHWPFYACSMIENRLNN